MKIPSLIFLFIFLGHTCFSQNTTEIVHIDSLPPNGVLLDKGWKFQAGDNPDFAKTEYDDSKWQSINPALDIRNQPAIAKSGICWLRLHLLIDSSVIKQQLAMMINQMVLASEMYLDGRLIYRFGKISSDPDEIAIFNPTAPVAFPVYRTREQVLAVRYVEQPKLNYSIEVADAVPLLQIKVYSVNAAFEEVRRFERHIPITNTFRIGVFLILAILQLAFYIYNPAQKAYLFFFLYAIFAILGDILQVYQQHAVTNLIIIIMAYFSLWQISLLFLLTALYLLLNQRKGLIYWCLILATISGLFLGSFVYSILVIGNLIYLDLVRTGFKALKLKSKGAWIITAGAISFLFFMGVFEFGAYFNLSYWSMPLGKYYTLADLLYAVGSLSIPVATTIYIGVDFAFTSHALKQKLTEVDELSKKTIAQEKEKQQILSSQKETLEKQVTERTVELKQSLEELKSTQAQLIQSEKMASLGELTAGIAHEIQNPLNFVNNFSEVNKELADEINDENNVDEIKIIANDIKQNSEKILFHGKRADAIVKGMLQHSRVSTGKKELTNINALADEYLRLSYHGMRAKDKEFEADFKTDFDDKIGKINIVPQDIGRVLLNLYNNAFYAVTERSQSTVNKEKSENLISYQPTVSVRTSLNPPLEGREASVCITVSDNGNGIPQKVIDKIFQPFFTTKPTGEGTGLGLSLSYDIVKAQGGEIKVETKEGEGTEFIIQLPI